MYPATERSTLPTGRFPASGRACAAAQPPGQGLGAAADEVLPELEDLLLLLLAETAHIPELLRAQRHQVALGVDAGQAQPLDGERGELGGGKRQLGRVRVRLERGSWRWGRNEPAPSIAGSLGPFSLNRRRYRYSPRPGATLRASQEAVRPHPL
jgi:hypothetical protein